ncbi:MAG: hypothetical protein WAO12_12155, partial [Venatoribacter sp.]
MWVTRLNSLRLLFLSSFIALAIGLAGCSSGSSSADASGDPTSPPTGDPSDPTDLDDNETPIKLVDVVKTRTTLKGQLVDPYIVGATVCADLDNNGICGVGEPHAVTNAKGEFDLGDWPTVAGEAKESVKIITLNKGSWQEPNYGLHQGKPYGLPLNSVIRNKVTVQVEQGQEDTAVAPIAIATPASTLQAHYNFTEDDVLGLLNQFKDTLGKTFTATDLYIDPLETFGKKTVASATDEEMAVFRAYLSLYAVMRTVESMKQIMAGTDNTFMQQLTQEGSVINTIFAGIVTAVVQGNNQAAYAPAIAQIQAGEEQMRMQITQQAGVNAGFANAAIKDFPKLSVSVAMSTSVAIIEYEMGQVQKWLKEKIAEVIANSTSPDDYAAGFATVADYVLTNMSADLTPERIAQFSAELGTKIYGHENKQHFESYRSVSLMGNNFGESVYQGIISASPLLAAGIQNQGDGFFIHQAADNSIKTKSTTALPVNAMQAINNYEPDENVTEQNVSEQSGIDEDVWSQFPVGGLQVSDLPDNQTCSISGTVYKENNEKAVGVPLYLTYGPSKSVYVVTDNNGKYEFTRLPKKSAAAAYWGDEELGEDHYFVGVIAGKRRPVPAFINYEANADSFFDCNNGGEVAVLNPQLRPIVTGTEFSGTFAGEFVNGSGLNQGAAENNEPFLAEIHSKANTQGGDSNVAVGGWIMENLDIGLTKPFSNLTQEGVFGVKELAGGDYKLRVNFYPTDGAD